MLRRLSIVPILAAAVSYGGAPALAHQDPPGCFITGPGIVVIALRSDGSSEVAGSVEDCERIFYRATLKNPLDDGTMCAFSGGTFSLKTPDGVVHPVSADVPCIGGTGGEGCDEAVDALESALIPYTVRPEDVVGGLVTAVATYTGGVSHDSPSNTAGVGSTTPDNISVVPCTAFIVDSTADDPDASAADGICATAGGACTLRAAIEQASASGDGPHTIRFDLLDDGGDVPKIVLGSNLPTASEALVIDGYSQEGSRPNANPIGALDTILRVDVNGNGHGCFRTFHADFTLRGLAIHDCTDAINVFSSSGGGAAPGMLITGNFIGTDPSGATAPGNASDGVSLTGQGGIVRATIGGAEPALRNLISANGSAGIRLGANSGSVEGVVQGNLIGTDASGTVPFGNGVGVVATAAGSFTIGGATRESGNVIAASTIGGQIGNGIGLGLGAIDNVIRHNKIGTDVTGTLDLGNGASGIAVRTGPTLIQDNVIAFNARVGVELGFNQGANNSGIRITENSIFSNALLGIDIIPLGPGPDPDPDDASDPGTNRHQRFPVLAPGVFPGGSGIDGTLDSIPDSTFRVEVFANDACDSPSGHGEGQTFVGANDAVTTDANGNASFTVTFALSLPAGTILTATAIADDGSASEFSGCTESPPTTTSTTLVVTTTTSTSSITTTSSSTSTTVPRVCELLDGKKLSLRSRTGKARRTIHLLSKDTALTLGAGNGSAADPVLHGGTLRVVTATGDGFDDTYDLPAERWRYRKKEGANRGYRLRPSGPFESIEVRPAKRLSVVARGEGLGHTLLADPDPVNVVLTLGAHCYCLRFGGDVTFQEDEEFLARDAPVSPGCP